MQKRQKFAIIYNYNVKIYNYNLRQPNHFGIWFMDMLSMGINKLCNALCGN